LHYRGHQSSQKLPLGTVWEDCNRGRKSSAGADGDGWGKRRLEWCCAKATDRWEVGARAVANGQRGFYARRWSHRQGSRVGHRAMGFKEVEDRGSQRVAARGPAHELVARVAICSWGRLDRASSRPVGPRAMPQIERRAIIDRRARRLTSGLPTGSLNPCCIPCPNVAASRRPGRSRNVRNPSSWRTRTAKRPPMFTARMMQFATSADHQTSLRAKAWMNFRQPKP